jgi:RNA polymerase sigma factor (sigma-70 family)
MTQLKNVRLLHQDKEKELEDILCRFSSFIRSHIHKFNIQKFGLDPDDIAQEVRIKIWRVLTNEKTIDNYASYIKKIVNSSVIDQLRKLKREEGIFLQEKQACVSELKMSYEAEMLREKHIQEKIGRAVEALIDSRKKAVRLYLLSMSIEEIAAFFGWSRDKTRNLLYRGLADLKKILKEKDIDYEDR